MDGCRRRTYCFSRGCSAIWIPLLLQNKDAVATGPILKVRLAINPVPLGALPIIAEKAATGESWVGRGPDFLSNWKGVARCSSRRRR